MNTQISFGLGAVILVTVLADQIGFDGRGSLFLAAKMLDLIQFIAFWR